jgi:hypothetical protein
VNRRGLGVGRTKNAENMVAKMFSMGWKLHTFDQTNVIYDEETKNPTGYHNQNSRNINRRKILKAIREGRRCLVYEER